MKSVLLLDPHLDQAIALAKFFRRYAPDWKVYGGSEVGRRPYFAPDYFVEIVECNFADITLSGQFDLVIPSGADSTYKRMSAAGDTVLGAVRFASRSLAAYDKARMLEAAAAAGVAVPETVYDHRAVNRFPVFYKDRREENRLFRNRGIALNAAALARLPDRDNLLFQEYIDSPGTYGVGFLARAGEMITHFAHLETVSLPKTGGAGVIVERIEDPCLIAAAARLLRYLTFDGWGLIEFKFCPRRRDYVFMELNAKFWQSLEFALCNQPQFFRLLFGIDYPAETVEKMVFARRYLMQPWRDRLRHLPRLRGCRMVETEHLLRFYIRHSLPEGVKSFVKNFGTEK